MKNEDKEAFEKWWHQLYDNHVEFRDWQGCDLATDGKEDMRYGWQAACGYKQKEINKLIDCAGKDNERDLKLQAENAKLRECVEFYADRSRTNSIFNPDYHDEEDCDFHEDTQFTHFGKYARQVLKELDEKL